MKLRRGVAGALLLLAACSDEHPGNRPGFRPESSHAALGVVPASEIATWTRIDPQAAGLDPQKPWPQSRIAPAMAFCLSTGKIYVFGGEASVGSNVLDDTWEWDGNSWSQVGSDIRPSGRAEAAMAYDPSRKSLIMFGGWTNPPLPPYATPDGVLADTWEWSCGTRQWSQLLPTASPDPVQAHGMVTDSGRAKVLLFGGQRSVYAYPYPDPMSNAVWEWEGAKTSWTNRTPGPLTVAPTGRYFPLLSFDEGRQKMFFFDGRIDGDGTPAKSVFWEWDPVSAGWNLQQSADILDFDSSSPVTRVAYDSLRRRQVMFTDATSLLTTATGVETWELDTKGPTWYVRVLSTGPSPRAAAAMAFDSLRGVMVLFGGDSGSNEVWEYKVTKLGNGEGCTAATASTCASGFCVDGVCCSSASCSGACQSCVVAGHEGTCVQAAAGTEVPGSCAGGLACDGNGNCKTKDGGDSDTADAGGGGGADGTGAGGTGGRGGTIAGGTGGVASGGAGGIGGTSTGGTSIGGIGGTVSGSTAGGASGQGGAGGTDSGGAAGEASGGVGDTGGFISGGAGGGAGAIGASGSPDGGGDSIPLDAGSPDGRRRSIAPDANGTARLHRAGCDCHLSREPSEGSRSLPRRSAADRAGGLPTRLGRAPASTPGLSVALLGVALLLRRRR
jgi:hypothetical protein